MDRHCQKCARKIEGQLYVSDNYDLLCRDCLEKINPEDSQLDSERLVITEEVKNG